jgi:thioredoxin-like negative regulator of GroEL
VSTFSRFGFASIALLMIAGLATANDNGSEQSAAATEGASANTAAVPAKLSNPLSQTYADAYKQTADGDKPLVGLVGASWCPACQAMKGSVMPTVAADGGLKDVAFALVNVDQQSDLAGKLMEGGLIPQLVVFQKTADGWSRKRLVGAQSVSTVEDFVGTAAKAAIAAKNPTSQQKTAGDGKSIGAPQVLSSSRSTPAAASHG